jgi:hypothetical protein
LASLLLAPDANHLTYSTGKTLFLQWLLLERLLDGKPTVLRTDKDYVYFYAKGPIRIPESRLASFADTWLLVDPQFGGGSPPMESGLFTIFTTSPFETRYEGWVRENSADLIIMNPWKWEELNFVGYACFRVMWFSCTDYECLLGHLSLTRVPSI